MALSSSESRVQKFPVLLDGLYVAQGFLRVCLEEGGEAEVYKSPLWGCILSSGWLAGCPENAKKRCHGNFWLKLLTREEKFTNFRNESAGDFMCHVGLT